jgi:imidazolonepropionase-like amidohydrolase
MRVATEGMRGSIAGARYFHLVDSPPEGRKQVRIQLKNGADFIKVYVAEITGLPTMTAKEQSAIVDEAHRQGVRVACTAHAGFAILQSIEAGCDSLELVTDLDQQSAELAARRGVFMTFGLVTSANNRSRTIPVPELSKASFQRALQAGIKLALGVNATGAHGKQPGPYHGEEAVEFAAMVEYGMTPVQAIRSGTSIGAENIGWRDRVGSIEKGKYADFIAVSGNPASDA